MKRTSGVVWLDSDFFYFYDDNRIFTVLRRAFLEMLARSLNLLNGREVVAIRRLCRSSKACEHFKLVTMMSIDERCTSRASYAIIGTTSSGKFFSVCLCEKHFEETIEKAREKIKKSVDNVIDGVIRELEKEMGEVSESEVELNSSGG